MKKVGTLKIVHEKYPTKKADQSTLDFHEEFDAANINNPDLKTHLNRAQEDLNPLKVLNIFSRISADDCEALGLDPVHGRPENLIWTYLPVPPVCIRPSVAMEGAAGRFAIFFFFSFFFFLLFFFFFAISSYAFYIFSPSAVK